ncbi:DUF7144 family membrane protein [Streptomyces thermocarboxydus]|uniref:DUF7144 family membrane protein n=1 Tax=Streptomyces TaxID=1883 RepID=UPI003B5087CD
MAPQRRAHHPSGRRGHREGPPLRGAPDYEYRFDLTSWGWIHLVVGVAVVIVGVGMLRGMSWRRPAGVTAAAVSLVTQFMFIPYYPLWSISVRRST